jgi:hypothetical protein
MDNESLDPTLPLPALGTSLLNMRHCGPEFVGDGKQISQNLLLIGFALHRC